MRKSLTDRGVGALKPRAQRYAHADPELRGHYIRVAPTGAKTFVAVTVAPSGKQTWVTIGRCDLYSIEEARERARAAIKRVRDGLPPVVRTTFADIAEQWMARHVRMNGLRSEKEITRLLNVHILPAWQDRSFFDIRRADVAALLDAVQDGSGARSSDFCLQIIRGIMNWYATRSDYQPVLVRGMRRQQGKPRARILADDEIRAIWKQAEHHGAFGGIVRMCLLAAQRSRKVAAMRWQDISIEGEWTIPAEPREKQTAGSLVLPELALAVIRDQPRLVSSPYIFAGRGSNVFNGYGRSKAAFDKQLPGIKPWVIHDLRRTARSLMSRAGVPSEHAERVMGHAIAGIEGVYDRHAYRDEKADALRRLAALIDGIVNPRDNVVAISGKQRKRR